MTPPPDPALSVEIPGHARGGTPVLGPIAFTLARGETLALTGPSGIGKTTLLRLIAGLDPAEGADIRRSGTLSVVFQEPTLLPWRSALDNLTLTTGIGRDEAAQWLAEVGLRGMGERFPNRLSLGQQRRLALARAFAARPAVLLMDEPFASLDAETAARMRDLFARLRAARPVATLLISHDAAEVAQLADRELRLGGQPARFVAPTALARTDRTAAPGA